MIIIRIESIFKELPGGATELESNKYKKKFSIFMNSEIMPHISLKSIETGDRK